MPTSPSKPNIACHRDVIVKDNLGLAAWAHRSWAYQRNGQGKAVNTHIQKTAHRHTKQEDEKLKNQGLPHNTFEIHWLRLAGLAAGMFKDFPGLIDSTGSTRLCKSETSQILKG